MRESPQPPNLTSNLPANFNLLHKTEMLQGSVHTFWYQLSAENKEQHIVKNKSVCLNQQLEAQRLTRQQNKDQLFDI